MREAQANIAIRWFAGYTLHKKLPDHSSLTPIRQRSDWRGIDSSVSVTSSSSLRSRPAARQHRQAVGPGKITRSRGRCAGNDLREGSCA